jgi:hypothetical protein
VTLVTKKKKNTESTGFSGFITLYCNSLKKNFYIKPLCIVAVSCSVCEHFRHIQVSPTYKLQAIDFFHTYPYLANYGSLGGLLNNTLNKRQATLKLSLKKRDKKTPYKE